MQGISNKFKSITKVRNTIMQIINNSQAIKRLIFYNTKNPLADLAIDNELNVVEQPNLNIDFINGIDKRIHSNYMKKILDVVGTHIFVKRLESDLDGQVFGVNTLVIDIVVPAEYSELDEENDREALICSTICTLIDQQSIIGGMGKVSVVHVKESMLENNNKEYNCLTMFVEVPTSNKA